MARLRRSRPLTQACRGRNFEQLSPPPASSVDGPPTATNRPPTHAAATRPPTDCPPSFSSDARIVHRMRQAGNPASTRRSIAVRDQENMDSGIIVPIRGRSAARLLLVTAPIRWRRKVRRQGRARRPIRDEHRTERPRQGRLRRLGRWCIRGEPLAGQGHHCPRRPKRLARQR